MQGNELSHVIRLDSIAGGGLPCGCGDGETICGRKATVGMLDPDLARLGRWILTPICKVCTLALSMMYEGEADNESGE